MPSGTLGVYRYPLTLDGKKVVVPRDSLLLSVGMDQVNSPASTIVVWVLADREELETEEREIQIFTTGAPMGLEDWQEARYLNTFFINLTFFHAFEIIFARPSGGS